MKKYSDDSKAKVISYAEYWLPFSHRIFIHIIEILTGRFALKKRYNEFQKRIEQSDTINAWDEAIDVMGFDFSELINLPKRNNDKGLLLIANHPFGVADGLSLGWIASKIDPNFKIIANGVLRQEPSLNRNILPIDFGLSRESMVVNIQTRKDAISYLKSGGVVAIFPAGQVSWAKKIGLPATDDDWKPLAGRLIKSSGCDVLPIKFHGQNSTLFQFASRIWNNKEGVSLGLTLRYSLYVMEICKTLDNHFKIDFLDIISNESLPNLGDRDLTDFLRSQTGL